MEYDKKKDVLVKKLGEVAEIPSGRIIRVGIYSYAGGEKKVGITRVVKRRGEERDCPIGRMTYNELSSIWGLLEDALEHLKE
jgi:hypothetical protein